MENQGCLLVFVKDPQAGRVKTRLARDYGDEFAAGLYGCFMLDTLASVGKGKYRIEVCFHPPEQGMALRGLLGDCRLRPQRGADLGERMGNAFADCFAAGFGPAVLIGSDCPDLPGSVVGEAFRALAGPVDAVIGPAVDGGYYLIGLRDGRFLAGLFSGIAWGGATVLEETLNILESANCRVGLLQPWQDVDDRADLLALIERSRGAAFRASRTMAFLRKSGRFPGCP